MVMGRTPSAFHWREDPRKVRLMEWLTTPPSERQPDSKTKLAAELGVTIRSLRDWMSKPDFREDWDREAKDIVGTPERAQQVLDTLFKAATDPLNRNHVQAAKLYLDATNAITPPPIKVEVTRPSELSDAELDALLAQGAAELRTERDARPDAKVIELPREPQPPRGLDVLHALMEDNDASD